MQQTSAIILAAGKSQRMGENKLLLPYKGKILLQHVVDLATSLCFSQVILVTTTSIIDNLNLPQNMKIVINDSESPQSESVKLGVLNAKEFNNLLFLTGDQPLINAEIINSLIICGDNNNIVYPINSKGKPCSPTFFGSRFRRELLEIQGDAGGRFVRKANAEICREVKVDDDIILMDIDTKEAYKQIQERSV